LYHGCIERFIDTLYRGVKNDFIEGGGLTFEFFTPALKIGIPPLMMYIKLLVLIGFDLNFPLISGINKLDQIKASFPTFQLSPCFILLIKVTNFTFTEFY